MQHRVPTVWTSRSSERRVSPDSFHRPHLHLSQRRRAEADCSNAPPERHSSTTTDAADTPGRSVPGQRPHCTMSAFAPPADLKPPGLAQYASASAQASAHAAAQDAEEKKRRSYKVGLLVCRSSRVSLTVRLQPYHSGRPVFTADPGKRGATWATLIVRASRRARAAGGKGGRGAHSSPALHTGS